MRDLIYDVINYCTASSCGLGVKKLVIICIKFHKEEDLGVEFMAC